MESPESKAEITWTPAGRLGSLRVAEPDLRPAVPRTKFPSLKVTVPLGVGLIAGVTLAATAALSVIDWLLAL